MTPPLCIIQARYHSTRLPGKMLLRVQDRSLIWRAILQAYHIFGRGNTVVAMSASDIDGPLWNRVVHDENHPNVVASPRIDDDDVLSRFMWAASTCDIVAPSHKIVRWTPDDWRKDSDLIRAVVDGDLFPSVEQSVEVFTLGQLLEWHWSVPVGQREHIGHLLPPRPAPPDDGLPWSIDTQDDYDRVVAAVGR